MWFSDFVINLLGLSAKEKRIDSLVSTVDYKKLNISIPNTEVKGS